MARCPLLHIDRDRTSAVRRRAPRSGLQPWVGWMAIGSMALLIVLTLIYRDMVPAVYYLVTLLTAVMLYR